MGVTWGNKGGREREGRGGDGRKEEGVRVEWRMGKEGVTVLRGRRKK